MDTVRGHHDLGDMYRIEDLTIMIKSLRHKPQKHHSNKH